MALEGAQEATLVLGFPGELALALIQHLLSFRPRTQVVVVGLSGQPGSAELLGRVFERHHARIRLIEGNVEGVDFGLARTDYAHLLSQVTTVHHALGLAESESGDAAKHQLSRRDRLVSAMREVLSFSNASQARGKFERLIVYSSLFVSGDHRGVFREGDLNVGQRFLSPVEEGFAIAEKMARAQTPRLPIVTLRAGQLVGDRRASAQGVESAPWSWFSGMLRSRGAFHVPASLRGDELLHGTPMDFLVRAAVFLGGKPQSDGQTVQLVEPNPPTVREALFRLAELAGRPRPIFGSAPWNWLSNPRFGSDARAERAFLQRLRPGIRYTTENSELLLAPHGLVCPGFDAYAGALVEAAMPVSPKPSSAGSVSA